MAGFTLVFTTSELAILDKALKEMPYGMVAGLINKINEQLSEQVAQATMVPRND